MPERLLRVVFALLMLLVAVTAGMLAGMWLAEILRGSGWKIPIIDLPVETGGGAIAITVLAATANDLMAVIVAIPDYYREKSGPIFKDAIKVFCSMFALFLAIYTLGPGRESGGRTNWMAAESFSDPEAVVVFPILYEANGTASVRDVLGEAERKGAIPAFTWEAGVDPPAGAMDRIVALMADCADTRRPQSLQFQIVGYASTKEFGELTSDDRKRYSNQLNTLLANERARRAAEAFTAAFAKTRGNNVWIEQHEPWQDYDTMVSERPTLDRLVDSQREKLEDWTRRVDVRVLTAGKCKRRDFLVRTHVIQDLQPGR
jgi:hypothetical protein